MQDKQKVTLYLPPNLHRQLKVRAALDAEPMSSIVERAVAFYLEHADVVEERMASQGRTYQIHVCPECATQVILNEGELKALSVQSGVLSEEGELVPC